MKLLTKIDLWTIPPLHAQEEVGDPVVHIKFFTPDHSWTWYATEGSPEGDDFIFFGFVFGPCPEWGYFSRSELLTVRGSLGLPIERDRHFKAMRISDALHRDGLDRFRPRCQYGFSVNGPR